MTQKPVGCGMAELSRRNFLKIAAVCGVGAAAQLRFGHWITPAPVVSQSRFQLGTVINLTLAGTDSVTGQQVLERAFGEIERLSAILSRFEPGSQLSELNQRGRIRHAAPELTSVLRQSLTWSRRTGGAFDVTVLPIVALYQQAQRAGGTLPTAAAVARHLSLVDYRRVRLDDDEIVIGAAGGGVTLDGIAKGFIVDCVVGLLRAAGFGQVIVEAGGDLYAAGHKRADQPWRIGIRATNGSLATVSSFELSNAASATSGDYQQAFTNDRQLNHLIDPRTGRSPIELSSATIVAPSAAVADALATAAVVLGAEATMSLVRRLAGVQAYLISKSGQTLSTSGFPS